MYHEKITAVINTFNSEEQIYSCLNSINSKIKVIVVENSENIKFQENLERRYKNVRCILAKTNLGYAKGNNLGLSYVRTPYALILNPDAKIEKDTIDNFFLNEKKIKNFSIMGPAQQDEFNKENFEDKNDFFEVESLKGFAMFLNLKEFEKIGFFDEKFFIYLEEIDLCKRLIKKNKKIYLAKNLKFNHLGGSSHNKDISFEMELSRNWHWMWSTFYYHKKNYGYLNALTKVYKKFFSSLFKIFIYTIFFQSRKKKFIFIE